MIQCVACVAMHRAAATSLCCARASGRRQQQQHCTPAAAPCSCAPVVAPAAVVAAAAAAVVPIPLAVPVAIPVPPARRLGWQGGKGVFNAVAFAVLQAGSTLHPLALIITTNMCQHLYTISLHSVQQACTASNNKQTPPRPADLSRSSGRRRSRSSYRLLSRSSRELHTWHSMAQDVREVREQLDQGRTG